MSENNPPTTPKFKNCLFEICKTPIEIFRKPTDGRKWKAAASARKTLAVQLAGYADADGSSIRPSTVTLAAQTGFSRAKVCRLLDDLRELGIMQRTGRHGQRGAAIRRLLLPEKLPDAIAGTGNFVTQDSILEVSGSILGVSDSILEVSDSNLRVSDSIPQSLTAMRHNLPLQTCPTDLPPKPVSEAVRKADKTTVRIADELREAMASAFSKARPGEQINWAGFSEVETLAAEFGEELMLKIWRWWLRARDTHGMKFHLKMFLKEFESTRADLERVELEEKNQQALWAATIAADNAKFAREKAEHERKWAEEEAQIKRQQEYFRETGICF